MINVLAICKGGVFMHGIESYLMRHNIQIVAVCNRSQLGVDFLRAYQPDLIIMDANWPERTNVLTGTDLLLSLLLEDATARIIVMTGVYEVAILQNFRRLGIKGYFYRNSRNALPDLIKCIHAVYGDGEYFAQ